MDDKVKAADSASASVIMGGAAMEVAGVSGIYFVECYDADGRLRWADTALNTVVTVGKNLILDQALAGSAYTAVEYMGLISSTSFSAIDAADTMSSHAGWLEAGLAHDPTYTAPRKTTAWSAAAAGVKALSAALSFGITSNGTIKGCFLNGGSGASATLDTTTGVLVSAGLFTGGDRIVQSGDTVQVSYTITLT